MFAMMVNFVNLLLGSLLAGGMFGVWRFLNPEGLDGPSYVLVQQQGIRTLNTIMPALGVATLVVTIIAAVMSHKDPIRLGFPGCGGGRISGGRIDHMADPSAYQYGRRGLAGYDAAGGLDGSPR